MKQEEILQNMRIIHDAIKEHPFRINFDSEQVYPYKRLLYDLSNAWCDFIYRNEDTTVEKEIRYEYGEWIHNYRQELRTYNRESFPMQFFDYYEQVLQTTHQFLETGSLEFFYSLDYFTGEHGQRIVRSELHELITKEKCGIDSPELPRYFPVTTKMCADEEKMKDYFMHKYWSYPEKTEEERLHMFETWKKDVKPILDWLNSRCKKHDLEHDIWRSITSR